MIGHFIFFLFLLLCILFYIGCQIKQGQFISWENEDKPIKGHEFEFAIWLFGMFLICLFFVLVLVIIVLKSW